MKINQKNVSFILVEPQTPGNIGAAARAIKTMGFENLILVNPCDFDVPQTRRLAHASEDILEKIQVFPTLPEALQDVYFAVAATNRLREYRTPIFDPEALGEKLTPVSQKHSVALVFGREQTGLTNEEIRACHALTAIPAAISHPSLNLSQAVMLYAYTLFKSSFADEKHYQWDYATYEEKQTVYEHLRRSLARANFQPIDNWDKFMMRFRRMFDRAIPETRDTRLMHKILQAFDEFIEHGDGKVKSEKEKGRRKADKKS